MADLPIRVILADDHAIVLNGLQRLFDSEADFAVVECCREGEDALRAVRDRGADVLVLDLSAREVTPDAAAASLRPVWAALL